MCVSGVLWSDLEEFESRVDYLYDMFTHKHQGKWVVQLLFPCVRDAAHASWLFPPPWILLVFWAPLSHEVDTLITPTRFTSCTKSLWNSHYIGDLRLSACRWCAHARMQTCTHAHTHATRPSCFTRPVRVVLLCCSLCLLFCFFFK